MKNLFVSYEIAKQLKEKGFKCTCFGGYYLFENKPDLCIYQDENEFSDSKEIIVLAPLYQQVIDWFRDEHKIEISLPIRKEKDKGIFWGGWIKKFEHDFGTSYGSNYTSYYEALNKSIEQALKLI